MKENLHYTLVTNGERGFYCLSAVSLGERDSGVEPSLTPNTARTAGTCGQGERVSGWKITKRNLIGYRRWEILTGFLLTLSSAGQRLPREEGSQELDSRWVKEEALVTWPPPACCQPGTTCLMISS